MVDESKPINLALQGGGAHGAFTWGVLDRFLEDERVSIAGISGTSAGAINAVAVADGITSGGRETARERMRDFWRTVGAASRLSPIQRTPVDAFLGRWTLECSPAYHAFDELTRLFSPYQLNPLNLNPLRDLLEASVDFEAVRACTAFELFVSATDVETGRVRVFPRERLTADMVMASACLPYLFQAVEIDGRPYWDGGYMGNPVLFPLQCEGLPEDVVVVQVNPIERPGTPRTPQEIRNRINEIGFNSSLLRELRSVAFVDRLVAEGKLAPEDCRQVRVHLVENETKLRPLGASSKMNGEWDFLTHLRDVGRATAEAWLDENFEAIGERSTVDLEALFADLGAEHHG
ncbi:MAG TPA: patatin-like phospholipase family protein [Paracoccaceae bacterium]|nr:patatin-like phospholipase family protein [Paracoccaceae bacterium]